MKTRLLVLLIALATVTTRSALADVEVRINKFYAREQKILFGDEACSWVQSRHLSLTKDEISAGGTKVLEGCSGANRASCVRYKFTCVNGFAYVNIPDAWTAVYIVYSVDNGERFRLYETPFPQPLRHSDTTRFAQTDSTATLTGGLVPLGEPIDAMLDLLALHGGGLHSRVEICKRANSPPLDAADYFRLLGQVSSAVRELSFELDQLEEARTKRDKALAQLGVLESLRQEIVAT